MYKEDDMLLQEDDQLAELDGVTKKWYEDEKKKR